MLRRLGVLEVHAYFGIHNVFEHTVIPFFVVGIIPMNKSWGLVHGNDADPLCLDQKERIPNELARS